MAPVTSMPDGNGQSSALLSRERSVLLIIDMQEKLRPAIAAFDDVAARIEKLIAAARLFQIPVLASEHCPESLGQIVSMLRTTLHASEIIEKSSFSAWAALCGSDLPANLLGERDQIIVAGVEAHVCVLQTSLDAIAHEKSVYLAIDAVSSRRELDAQTAAARMNASGASCITSEMAIMEWTRTAVDAQFKSVLSIIR